MHASMRYTAEFKSGDFGGNSVKICTTGSKYCGMDNSLHSYWDGAIGSSESVSSAISKAALLPATKSAELDITDPDIWAQESFALAKDYAYASPVGASKSKAYQLPTSYRIRAGSVAETRISLAGARLAVMLNNIFH